MLEWGILTESIAFLSDTSYVWPAIITIITWNTLPLVTLTFLASLKSIPIEQIDAASVDGAKNFKINLCHYSSYDSFYNYYDINVYFLDI